MFANAPMKEAMAAAGYGLVRDHMITSEFWSIHRPSVYKALWSSESVEHFIYMGSDIRSRKYFIGNFGLRAPIAEEFSRQSLLKYAHPHFRVVFAQWDPEVQCMLTFAFGRFDLARRIAPHRFFLPGAGSSELVRYVSNCVNEHVLPAVRHVTTLNSFLDLVVTAKEPFPWFVGNGFVRAAQIVAVATRLGFARDNIREMLRPQDRLICASLAVSDTPQDPVSCVEKYLDILLLDWASGYG